MIYCVTFVNMYVRPGVFCYRGSGQLLSVSGSQSHVFDQLFTFHKFTVSQLTVHSSQLQLCIVSRWFNVHLQTSFRFVRQIRFLGSLHAWLNFPPAKHQFNSIQFSWPPGNRKIDPHQRVLMTCTIEIDHLTRKGVRLAHVPQLLTGKGL